MDLGLTDRVFVVTGGARGLGRATADVLVEEGARVVLSGRTAETLDRAVDALGHDHATSVVADNAEPDAASRLLEAARSRWGRFDGALISVGGPTPGPLLGSADDDWERETHAVLLGGIRLMRDLGDALGAGGSLALVLSSSVRNPIADLAISNALRPGLAMAAKTLADELGPRGVRVNGLLPGRVETERVQELDAASGDSAAARARHEAMIPLRRYGRPEEFGRAAAWLLSPAASFVTGAMLPVDGGLQRGL